MDVAKYASDPLQFISDLIIPSASGSKRFAEVMAPHQREWFEAVAPSLLAVSRGETPPCGRFWTERTKGASKDCDVAVCLLYLLAFSRNKLDMQVGAADRDQAAELKKIAVDVLRLSPWLMQRIDVLAWSLVCRATGSECSIVAADVAGSHGARPDIVVMNELSHVTKEEFASNLLDNATKRPNGLVIVATNAGYADTFQARWRQTAIDSDRWNFHQFAQPAPWLDDAEIEEAERRNSKSRFNRLFWGEWISQSGDALDVSDITACIDSDLAPMGCRLGWSYVAGLDLSVSQDHSALVILGIERKSQQIQLAYSESWRPDPATKKVDLMRIEQVIRDTNGRYKFAAVGFDPYQCELMAQRLTLGGVKMKQVDFVGKNLNTMASTLLDVFRSRRIKLYNDRQLIDALGRLSIVEKSYGYKLEASRTKDAGHADLAIALSIALMLGIENASHIPKVAGIMKPMPGNSAAAQIARQQREQRIDEMIWAKYDRLSKREKDCDNLPDIFRQMKNRGR